MDREKIIEILNEWNFWNRKKPETFSRKEYEDEIKLKAGKEILFLKGVRRSGKSTLFINFMKSLISDGTPKKNILFVNLEDPRFADSLSLELLDEIKEAYIYHLNPSHTPYIFLDEIQNIPKFEKWLLKEYELKKSYLFITGSNSKLLSKEIGSAISGRYFDIEVFPLSFMEFLNFKGLKANDKLELINNKVKIEKYFDEYTEFGGFPKVCLLNNEKLKKDELKNYFDSILLRDIVSRYKLDNFLALEQIAVFLLSNTSNLKSINSIKKTMNLSFDLVNNYIEYLENAFIIFRIPLFDWSLKKQRSNPHKVYSIDTGMAKMLSFEVGKKEGALLENIVFLELKRMQKEIYYYKTNGKFEVDFVIKEKNRIMELIQVCRSIKNEATLKREVRSLLKAAGKKFFEDAKLTILTMDKSHIIEEGNKIIEVKNILEWLLF